MYTKLSSSARCAGRNKQVFCCGFVTFFGRSRGQLGLVHRCPAAALLDRPPACHNPVGAGGVVLDKALVDTLYNFLGSSKVSKCICSFISAFRTIIKSAGER